MKGGKLYTEQSKSYALEIALSIRYGCFPVNHFRDFFKANNKIITRAAFSKGWNGRKGRSRYENTNYPSNRQVRIANRIGFNPVSGNPDYRKAGLVAAGRRFDEPFA
jgi:hypothetical protein